MQGQIVSAQQSVLIAERTADATIKTMEGEAKSIELKAEAKSTKLRAEANAFQITEIGKAEGSKILEIGNATAEAYEKQVKAMGAENFAKFKITEEIGKNKIEIIPKILISGGNGSSPIDGLVATQLLNYIGKSETTPALTPTTGNDKQLLTEGK